MIVDAKRPHPVEGTRALQERLFSCAGQSFTHWIVAEVVKRAYAEEGPSSERDVDVQGRAICVQTRSEARAMGDEGSTAMSE